MVLGSHAISNREPQVVIDHDGIALGFGRNRRFAWNDIHWVRLRRLGFRPQLADRPRRPRPSCGQPRLSMWNLDDGLRPVRGTPAAVRCATTGSTRAPSAMLDAVEVVPAQSREILESEQRRAMRRFIVGLLATIGTVTLLAISGVVVFLATGPLAPQAAAAIRGAVARPARACRPRIRSSSLLSGGLWRDQRDLTETVQLLWQAADDPRVVGIYVEIGDDDAGLARVQELRQAIARFRGKGKFAVGFAEGLGGSGDHFADYYLASALDQIWLQPSGGFAVAGPCGRDAVPARRAGQARRAGSKAASAASSRARPTPSPRHGYTAAARENLQQLIDGLYGQFIERRGARAQDRSRPSCAS